MTTATQTHPEDGEGRDVTKFSVVIPYKQRLHNLRLALESLARQSLPSGEFEVLVGAMEYDPAYVSMCAEFNGRLDITSVLSAREWQTAYARNMALRQAVGEVVILLDADMVVPTRFLENLYQRHFASGQNVCVVGQMLDYDNNTSDVLTVEAKPFEHYAGLLEGLEAAGEVREDPRLAVEHVIPWSFAWTALIALPNETIRRHGLLFDVAFRGYGVEDLEWAYRVSACGTPISMAADVYGIHLPHTRDLAANQRSEVLNYRHFLRTWPEPDVELACAFGDFEANALARGLRGEVSAIFGPDRQPAVVRGTVDGLSTLVVGAAVDSALKPADPDLRALFQDDPQVLPLVGLALPVADGEIDQCFILEPVARFSGRYRERILGEGRRASAKVRVLSADEPIRPALPDNRPSAAATPGAV